MRTYVRVTRGDDPARRPRRVLRVGRAARRPSPARASHGGRDGSRALGQLRGPRVRHPHGDGRTPGPPPLPARDRRQAADVGLLRGEQGGLRGVRRHHPARRRAVDRRGVPRRPRAGAHPGHAHRDRGAVAERRRRARGTADHGRGGEDEVPRQGRERRRQARRAAGRAARRRARLSASAAGRAAVGCRTRHRRQAPRAWDPDRRPGRGDSSGGARVHARPRVRPAPARARPQPRSPAGARSAAAAARSDRSTHSVAARRGRGKPSTSS